MEAPAGGEVGTSGSLSCGVAKVRQAPLPLVARSALRMVDGSPAFTAESISALSAELLSRMRRRHLLDKVEGGQVSDPLSSERRLRMTALYFSLGRQDPSSCSKVAPTMAQDLQCLRQV